MTAALTRTTSVVLVFPGSVVQLSPTWPGTDRLPHQDIRAWGPFAACRDQDTERWFPASDDPEGGREGREFCGRCPVMTQCREYAIATGIDYGTWGGMSANARKKERRRRAQVAKTTADPAGAPTAPAGLQRVVSLTCQGMTASEIASLVELSKRSVVRLRARARQLGLLPPHQAV